MQILTLHRTGLIHLCGLILCCLGLGLSQTSYAHQLQYIVSTVSLRDTQPLQVTHRFDIHDSEHALQKLFQQRLSLHKPKVQQDFAAYISDNFGIRAGQQALELVTVGYELEGKYFWVYQESKTARQSPLTIQSALLFDVFPEQIHWLNIEHAGGVTSASLHAENTRYTLEASP